MPCCLDILGWAHAKRRVMGPAQNHQAARYYQSTVEEPCPTIEVLYGLIQLNQPPMTVDEWVVRNMGINGE